MSQYRYAEVLSKLYKVNMYNPVKLGLENMKTLNRLIGNPLKGIPVVHIAGTNGKGSVSLKISDSLINCGITTGLFASPHISSFRERIQVNKTPISELDIETILPELYHLCDIHKVPGTFFELTTALAFAKYQRAQCQAVVLEAGLGGRLDATNIVSPSLCIITSVQLDHMNILGDTIKKIAVEKSGIMKPGVAVLVGPGCPIDLLREQAQRVGAPFHTIEDVLTDTERASLLVDDPWPNDKISSLYMQKEQQQCKESEHQQHQQHRQISSDVDKLNQDIAKAALKLLRTQGGTFNALPDDFERSTEVQRALLSRPPCRFEIFPQVVRFPAPVHTTSSTCTPSGDAATATAAGTATPTNDRAHEVHVDVVLDIAHNVDSIKALAAKVKLHYPRTSVGEKNISAMDVARKPLRIVLGMSEDKDIDECLPPIIKLVEGCTNHIYCTQARHPRAMPSSELSGRIDTLARKMANGVSSHAPSPSFSAAVPAGSSSTPANANEAMEAAAFTNTATTGGADSTSSSCSNIRSAVRQAIVAAARASSSGVSNSSSSSSSSSDGDTDDFSISSGSSTRSSLGEDAVPVPVVVVCGSAFIMAEVRAALGVIEPKDGDILVANSNNISSGSDGDASQFADSQEHFSSQRS